MFNTSFVKGNGYGSFFVATFSFYKSIEIISLPFFLGITTMGDKYVASSINWISQITNNIIVSNSIMCYVNSSGILFKNLYVHAKTSLNSCNNYSSSNTLHVSKCALIFTIYGSTLVPKLNFINYWSSINIHPATCNSYELIFARVSSIATLLGWCM